MSYRSLIELNHDFVPGRSPAALAEWAAKIASYARSGDARELPYGVILRSRRHHTEPCPLDLSGALRAEGEA
ncbi:MAG: hypothetical protein WDN25_03805 [Acetobacteraceae bacterium]